MNKIHQKGILIIVSGFAGSGKGSIMKELLLRYPSYALSVSATTRSPRPGEIDGIDYFFKTREEFEQMIAENAFLEHAEYVGNYYGTPCAYVDQMLEEGKDVILEIEVQGALQVKALRSEAVLIFVTPPSAEILENRLSGRGTESADVIQARMRRSAKEAELMEQYDYILVNDVLSDAVEQLHGLIQGTHIQSDRMQDFIRQLRQELNKKH